MPYDCHATIARHAHEDAEDAAYWAEEDYRDSGGQQNEDALRKAFSDMVEQLYGSLNTIEQLAGEMSATEMSDRTAALIAARDGAEYMLEGLKQDVDTMISLQREAAGLD